jgi:DNA repair photolyase
MSLVKSKGNMYDWVTHMHTHLAGECSHRCLYCYVQTGPAQMSGKYKGRTRLVEKELTVNYGAGKTIFIEHMNDLFAYPGVSIYMIEPIFCHIAKYPDNLYVFQTKNSGRAWEFRNLFPPSYMMGTTIETNRILGHVTLAPAPSLRASGLALFAGLGKKTFITIEPILDFDVDELSGLIVSCKPSFVNIGADSKGCHLPEPSPEKVRDLISAITRAGIEIKKKHNLGRLLA